MAETEGTSTNQPESSLDEIIQQYQYYLEVFNYYTKRGETITRRRSVLLALNFAAASGLNFTLNSFLSIQEETFIFYPGIMILIGSGVFFVISFFILFSTYFQLESKTIPDPMRVLQWERQVSEEVKKLSPSRVPKDYINSLFFSNLIQRYSEAASEVSRINFIQAKRANLALRYALASLSGTFIATVLLYIIKIL